MKIAVYRQLDQLRLQNRQILIGRDVTLRPLPPAVFVTSTTRLTVSISIHQKDKISMDGFVVTVKIISHLLVVVFTTIHFKNSSKKVGISLVIVMSFSVLVCDQFCFSSDGLYSSIDESFNDITHEQFTSDFTCKSDNVGIQLFFCIKSCCHITNRWNEHRGTLLTALLIPTPVPQIHTPKIQLDP